MHVVSNKGEYINRSPYYKISDKEPTNLTTITYKEPFRQLDTKNLLKKNKISVSFIGKADNLGIIAIPFNTHNKSVNDQIIFRLKELGQKDWHYEVTYNTNQIQNNIPFPFGFPVITNSKNIKYLLEMESLSGTSNNYLSLKKEDSFFLTQYKYSGTDLVRNPKNLLKFINDKSVEQLSLITQNELLFIIIFSAFLPLVLYKMNGIIKNMKLVLNVNLKSQKNFNVRKKNKNLIFFYSILFKRNNLNKSFFNFIQLNSVSILIILLALIVGSNNLYNHLYPAIHHQELRWVGFPSSDFNTSVYIRTSQMLNGQEMKIGGADSASGQLMPLLFSPFLSIFNPSLDISYFSYLALTLVVFAIFFTLLMRKSDKTIINGGLVFLIAFFLTEPGKLGILQGNTDILLAPIMGILMLFVISSMKKKNVSLGMIILLGLLAGAIMNAKIFLLPIAIAIVIFSKRKVLTGIVIVVTFLALIYIPNLFGSQSSLSLYINKIIHWDSFVPVTNVLWANHSLYATASFFTGCDVSKTCETQIANTLLALTFFLIMFITPFLFFIQKKKIYFNRNTYTSILNLQKNKYIAIIFFILSIGLANFVFKVAYDYRLYFFLPIALILLRESEKSKKALAFCYLAMFSLLLGGVWILPIGNNVQPWTVDSRLLSIFFIFHYFFLILSAITLWKESIGAKKPLV